MDIDCIVSTLIDAGCDEAKISYFLSLYEKNEFKKQIKFLSEHRKKLLDKVHQENKCIDCLDYLVNSLKKCYAEGEKNEKNI